MSINPIGGQTSSTQQVQAASRQGHGHGVHKAGLDAAAKALGMSSSDLRAALTSGTTLSSLAQAKGVSADALTSAVSDALKKANPSLTSDRAAAITQRMISGTASASQTAASGGSGDRDHDGDAR
jgi:uncharacterized protein YidB (DUF937 family)